MKNNTDIFKEIKDRINCVDYAISQNLPIRRDGDRCTSFIEGGSNRTACVIREDYWFDFKADCGGDVIDLCAELNHKGDKSAAVQELKTLLGIETDTAYYRDWARKTKALIDRTDAAHAALREEDRAYMRSRGITDETVDRLKIGYSSQMQRIVIPYFKNGAVVFWNARATRDDQEPKYLKPKKDGINENVVWGLQTLKRDGPLIICEGAFDAISFEQEGFAVLSGMGGHFSRMQLKEVYGICKNREEIILAFDNDDAGTKFFFDLSKKLIDNHITNFSRLFIPTQDGKDVSDYYSRHHTLEPLLSTRKNGLAEFCSDMSPNELKKLAFCLGRHMSRLDVEAWFSELKGYSAGWLKELKTAATKTPPEKQIADEVRAEHVLIYSETLGFSEYTGTHWERRTDNTVKGYIGDALDGYKTGSKLNSILSVIKSETGQDSLEFNKSRVFNFQNGTLDLETMEFREHRQTDYCNYVSDYDYNPSADCPGWLEFIYDIAAEDLDRVDVLQEIAGYTLFPDSSLQVCPYLLGSGSNGKSVYLDVLKAVIGDSLVSTVPITGLAEPFQRIQLATSMLNVCSEAKSDVKGTEDVFKQVVAGERINGCYKGKDFFDFIPKAKMIIAANMMIKPKDMSYGIIRRMLWVNFERQYVAEPESPNQRKLNPNIKKELLEEKAGIFNWMLEGYKRLARNQAFTKSRDQEELSKEFEKSVNPIIIFIEETDLLENNMVEDEFISYEKAYGTYLEWCRESGRKNPMQRTNFSKTYSKEFCRLNPEWEQVRIKRNGKTLRGLKKVYERFDHRHPDRHPDEGYQQGYVLEGSKLVENW